MPQTVRTQYRQYPELAHEAPEIRRPRHRSGGKLSCLPTHRVPALIPFLGCGVILHSQIDRGIIEGIVVDPQGAVVPDVQPYWAHNTILLQFCALRYLSRLGLGLLHFGKGNEDENSRLICCYLAASVWSVVRTEDSGEHFGNCY